MADDPLDPRKLFPQNASNCKIRKKFTPPKFCAIRYVAVGDWASREVHMQPYTSLPTAFLLQACCTISLNSDNFLPYCTATSHECTSNTTIYLLVLNSLRHPNSSPAASLNHIRHSLVPQRL